MQQTKFYQNLKQICVIIDFITQFIVFLLRNIASTNHYYGQKSNYL
jgi:hypothetical protein